MNPGSRRGPVRGKIRALGVYVALTLAFAYPVALDPGDRVIAGGPDTELFMWTLAWNAHAMKTNPTAIFDANIYYPERHTLAYSENLIGSAFLAAPILWISDNPVLALNAVALLSCVLCGLGAYVLGRRLGLQERAALLCGLIFAFSPPRFFRITQLHLTTVQWIPFALASLHAYFDGGRKRDLRLAVFFFTLQALTSGHGAVFLLVGALCIVAYRVVAGDPPAFRRRIRDLGLPGVLLLLPAIAVSVPYRLVQNEMGLRRGLYDWAATPESYLASPSTFHAWVLSLSDARINENATAFLFPGYLPLVLTAVAVGGVLTNRLWRFRLEPPAGVWSRLAVVLNAFVGFSFGFAVLVAILGRIRLRFGDVIVLSAREPLRAVLIGVVALLLRLAIVQKAPVTVLRRIRRSLYRFRHWRKDRHRDAAAQYALVALVSFGLAAGPPLSLWPLVYWLPGLNFIRVPSRFMLLTVLGLAVLAALGFQRLRERVAPRRESLLAAGIGGLLIAEFAILPMPSVPYRVDVPAVDRWLDTQPKPFVVVELPLLHSEALHTRYMLHSTAHSQKMVNGYSGIRPPLHTTLFNRLRGFPDDFTIRSLLELGVTYVVIHTDLYPPGEWATVSERMKRFSDVFRLVYADSSGLAYAVKTPQKP